MGDGVCSESTQQSILLVLISEDGYLLRLEADLRAILLKISVCDALLQPNPPGLVLLLTHKHNNNGALFVCFNLFV